MSQEQVSPTQDRTDELAVSLLDDSRTAVTQRSQAIRERLAATLDTPTQQLLQFQELLWFYSGWLEGWIEMGPESSLLAICRELRTNIPLIDALLAA